MGSKNAWLYAGTHAQNIYWTHRFTHIPLKIEAEPWPCSAAFSFVSSIRCSSLWRASCSCLSSFSASYFIPGKKEVNTNDHRYAHIWNQWNVQKVKLEFPVFLEKFFRFMNTWFYTWILDFTNILNVFRFFFHAFMSFYIFKMFM